MALNEMQIVGITAGLGALNVAKRLRRIEEGVVKVPMSQDWIENEEERQVARVNKYFDTVVPTEVIDGRPK